MNKNLERIIAAPYMVIHPMDHSEKGDTYLKRDDIMELDKCEAEVSPSKQNIYVWVGSYIHANC